MQKLIGAVLAGGQSSRFGSDKADALLAGERLLDHAIAALRAHVDIVVVCGRMVDGLPCLTDRPAPGLGPLGGINAALHFAQHKGFDAVVTTGCDMPCFPAALFDALAGDGPAVLDGQHLAGFWPSSLADALDAHLRADNNRSLFGWFDQVSPRFVALPGLVMPNINRVSDLHALTQAKS